jgi:NAD+ synthase (glutamine-hydrolysing)
VEVPFGPGLLFEAADVPGFVLHVEVCEDMFVRVPPARRRR